MSFPASKSNLVNVRKVKGRRQLSACKPMMTSLIDVMTILLIYLLQSFSTEGQIVTVSKELDLPTSSAEKKPDLRVVITVNNRRILAENHFIVNVDQVLSNDNLIIDELYQWLGKRREITENIARYSTKTSFTGDVMIMGDKRIQFRLLKKIMYTCGQQGYNNFTLAVRKKD